MVFAHHALFGFASGWNGGFSGQMPGKSLEVFTTRVDTIFGATAIVLSANHPLPDSLLEGVPGRSAIESQLKAMRGKSMRAADIATAEKEGFFIGRFAINPFSGEQIPIWVANFVLAEYGTGGGMCVPAHDQRDYEFAEKYHLPVKIVVQPIGAPPLRLDRMSEAFTEYGKLVDSSAYTGLMSDEAIKKMSADAKAKSLR